jgi:hypothetical protein
MSHTAEHESSVPFGAEIEVSPTSLTLKYLHQGKNLAFLTLEGW